MSLPIVTSKIAGSLWIAASIAFISVSLARVGLGEEAEPRYNPDEETTIGGVVIGTNEVPRHSPVEGIHLLVIAKGQEIDIYLGPSDFIRDFDMTFSKGDSVWITGVKVIFGRKRFILARRISMRGTVLYLRDSNGRPNWRKDAT